MRGVAVALLLLVAAPVAAQMGGQRMPDAREMSGIARPDAQVPAGTVTVKLTRGELGRFATQGAPVHLVVYDRGPMRKLTRGVDEEGRAEFTGLATGAAGAYQAVALYNDDRLESQIIDLPPQVGIRMMLTSRKTDEKGVPVGERIDDAREADLPGAPAGQVHVYLGGEVGPGQVVRLLELGDAAPRVVAERAAELAGNDRLFAVFRDVPSGPDHVYVAEVVRGASASRSKAFMVAGVAGASTWIVAASRSILIGLQGGAQLDDENMWFQLSVAVANVSGAPMVPEGGLVIPLPLGFKNASVPEEMQEKADVVPGEGLRWKGMLAPGQQDVTVQFALAVEDGEVSFQMPAPYGVEQGQLAFDKGRDTRIRGAVADARRIDNGQEFWVVRDLAAPPGGTIAFQVTGLPRRPAALRMGAWVAGLIVLALIGWAAWASLRGPRSAESGPVAADAARRRELASTRDQLYDELVLLEKRRAADAVDDDEYERERRGLVARLVVVHRELEAIDVAGKGKSARV